MLVAFLILPYGCERDEEIDISTKAKFNAPSITQAKQHVEQHTTLNLKDPNNFLQSRDLEGSLTVDWELSGIKEYKDEPEQQVDILYTPIYINNDADAKMFVGSVEYNGEIKSNIFCLIYTDLENTTTFSGYILRFDLNGALLEARKYQNGSIVNPQDNTSEGMSRTNCDNETIFDMLIMLLDGGGSLSNWHGCLDTVVVYGSNTSIDAGDSTGGGSPLDSAIVTSINIPALETNSNNPAGLSVPYWYTQSVTANGFNISLWLEIHPLTPIAQWLMTEATIDQLQQIANFLNDHKFKIRDEYLVLDGFDGFEPADSPTASTGYAISEFAKGFALLAIEALENDGEVDFEEYLIYNPTLDQDYLNRMAIQEREIYNGLNINQKKHYLMSAQQATHFAQIYYPRSLWNGKGDAYRHGLWNALATTRLGVDLTQQLTTAHESDPLDPNYDNHFKEREMDLFNNQIGREIGSLHSSNLVNIMLTNMNQGTLKYLNNLTNGDSGMATNSSSLIPTNQ